MKKLQKKFEDGEIIKYLFNNGSVILVLKKQNEEKYTCSIGWDFGELACSPFDNLDEFKEKQTKNKITINEIQKLYKLLKKQKNKTKEIKQLIQALLIINHDIKQQIFVEQNLF